MRPVAFGRSSGFFWIISLKGMLCRMMTFLRSGENMKPSTLPSVSESCLRLPPSRFIFHTSPPRMKAMVSLSSHWASVSLSASVVSWRCSLPSAFIIQSTWWLLFSATL